MDIESLIEEMIYNHKQDKVKWAASLQNKEESRAWLDFFARNHATDESERNHRKWALRILKRDGVIQE
jgi:hypothetical protein